MFNSPRYIEFLVAAWTLSIALESVFKFKILGASVYLPELLGFPILIWGIFAVGKGLHRGIRLQALDVALAIYVGILGLSWLCHPTGNALLEFLAGGYFWCLYAVARLAMHHFPALSSRLLGWIAVAGLLAAMLGVAGYFMHYYGYNEAVLFEKDYPFLGDTARARGGVRGPLFLAMDLAICFFAAWIYFKKHTIRVAANIYWAVLLFLWALVLTKSKTILPFLGAIAWGMAYKHLSYRLPLRLLAFAMVFLYIFLSHFLVLNPQQAQFEKQLGADFYVHKIAWKVRDDLALVPTFYYQMKTTAWRYGLENQPLGLGGNNLILQKPLAEFARPGQEVIGVAPHSTLWGAWAETGIFGLVAIFGIAWCFYKRIRGNPTFWIWMPLFLFLCAESLNFDLMNCRLLYLMAAIAVSDEN